jgi:uncharacterized protein YceK
MIKILVGLLILAAFTASGCATIGSLQPGGGSKFVVQNKTYAEVWKAAITVVTRSLTIVEIDKEKGIIKSEKGAGLSTWGEVVGVFITPPNTNSNTYAVEVLSQKRSRVQITGQDWEKTIVEGMKAELNI